MARARDYRAEYARSQQIAKNLGYSGRSERFRLQRAVQFSNPATQRAYQGFRSAAYNRGMLSSRGHNAQALRLFNRIAGGRANLINRASEPRSIKYHDDTMNAFEYLERRGIVSSSPGSVPPPDLTPEQGAAWVEARNFQEYGSMYPASEMSHEPSPGYDPGEAYADYDDYYDSDWDDWWASYLEA